VETSGKSLPYAGAAERSEDPVLLGDEDGESVRGELEVDGPRGFPGLPVVRELLDEQADAQPADYADDRTRDADEELRCADHSSHHLPGLDTRRARKGLERWRRRADGVAMMPEAWGLSFPGSRRKRVESAGQKRFDGHSIGADN
jgi:hypothetical protein